ncbi:MULTISPECIES: YbjN domain-containing protein [unclassified Actinomyces]|uniref:YbjN domain-containing protein n=1 Tax=unclassified Actinomyces TaxID=2609248 RepID=UPI002017BE05|nr:MULTISPECIES: YbjN domain-containing protein [unclassified Actinomyces]MCL3777564.1 YbjN domain-containing protein [Actinomyces sp. AC-20-1]MCL3790054.1 YbjN domain-containing protein [Actinomyces sp. 187325]MCL3791095.1 YbjN domain-containing protein [Actinomyces sp. 186855]MCL3794984.1 YbjN domain-containing protein [Actinomyces sp. 217892]
MSVLSHEPDGGARVPGPLDPSRLARVLAGAGVRVRPAPDGALVGRWDGVVVRVTVGEGPPAVLNVVGLLPKSFPSSARPRLREAVEERHRSHPWPTCFLTELPGEGPDGGILLGGACALGTGAGVTDAQVLRHVRASVVSFQEAFAELRDALR